MPVTASTMNGAMVPRTPATFEEVQQLREAVAALATEIIVLRLVIDGQTPVPELLAALHQDEPEAVKRVRRALAPGETVEEFAERLRKQATAVGFAGPPADANAHLREARAAAYARRWPGGTDDPDAQPKGWRRRGRR